MSASGRSSNLCGMPSARPGLSITCEPVAVVQGLPGATAGRVGSGSAFEKGKAAALVRKRGESSHRPAPVASRLAHKVVIRKTKKKVAPVVEEAPVVENIVTIDDMADILVRMNRGEPLSSHIIHQADVYSKPPKVLVQEITGGCTLWMDKGNRKAKFVWLFIDSAASYGGKRRSRMVSGSGLEENGRWLGDHPAVPVEEFPWASKTQYYYRINCTTAKAKGEWTGWCMTEFSLTNREEVTYRVCMVYQSNRSHPKTPTADSSPPGAETPTIEQGHDEAAAEEEDGASVDASLGSPSAGSATGLAFMANILLQAAQKATGCGNSKKACKINEFMAVRKLLHRIIDELRLDRFIISELLCDLKIRLQNVALDKELPPKARDVIVSYGELMWKTIYSAHFDECVRQAGFLPKVEGSENERRPSPVNSSAGASSSSVKRKADHDHEEAPPSVRQELTDKDREHLDEAEHSLLFDADMATGDSHGVHQAALYADIFNVDGSSVVQAQQQGLAEAAEGGSRLGTEEVAVETLPAEWWSPGAGGLPDLSIGDGLLDMPIDDGWLNMFIDYELPDMTIGDISCPAPAPASAMCASGLHGAADCQKLNCSLSMTKESVAFDNWAWR